MATDWLLDGVLKRAPKSDPLFDLMRKAVHVKIDDVARYYFESSDQEEWDDFIDLKQVVPPHQAMWVEFKQPAKIVSSVRGTTFIEEKARVSFGFFVLADRSNPTEAGESVVSTATKIATKGLDPVMPTFANKDAVEMLKLLADPHVQEAVKRSAVMFASRATWTITAFAFMSDGKGRVQGGTAAMGSVHGMIDKDGSLLPTIPGAGAFAGGPTTDYMAWARHNRTDIALMLSSREGVKQWFSLLTGSFQVVMLAMGFLNRNTAKLVPVGERFAVEIDTRLV